MDNLGKVIEEKMKKSVESTRMSFASIRTGRASPHILDKINIDYYGTIVPLKQLAGISIPEPRTIVIQPYDKGATAGIEKAISKSDLGLNPSVEGGVIRLSIPQLTEERRKELVKVVRKTSEEGKVALRNIRRDAVDEIKSKKNKEGVSEDTLKFQEEEIQKLTEKYSKEVEKLLDLKEKEIMEV